MRSAASPGRARRLRRDPARVDRCPRLAERASEHPIRPSAAVSGERPPREPHRMQPAADSRVSPSPISLGLAHARDRRCKRVAKTTAHLDFSKQPRKPRCPPSWPRRPLRRAGGHAAGRGSRRARSRTLPAPAVKRLHRSSGLAPKFALHDSRERWACRVPGARPLHRHLPADCLPALSDRSAFPRQGMIAQFGRG